MLSTPNPSGKGSPNPYSERQTNPRLERRATPAPTPSPTPLGLDLGTSTRALDPLTATTATVLILRPDWREDAVRAVLARDPRPWRTVVAAALTCALDPRIEHPNAIETSNPAGSSHPTPVPPPIAEVYAPRQTCGHGGIVGRCPMCRTYRYTQEVPA